MTVKEAVQVLAILKAAYPNSYKGMTKYLAGHTDEDHLLASAWNLLWAIEMRCKHPELVNTPWEEDKNDEKKVC